MNLTYGSLEIKTDCTSGPMPPLLKDVVWVLHSWGVLAASQVQLGFPTFHSQDGPHYFHKVGVIFFFFDHFCDPGLRTLGILQLHLFFSFLWSFLDF